MKGTQKSSAKTGLGRGFDALLPQDFDKSILLDSGEKIHNIALDKIKPHAEQPRTKFESESLQQLASSIKQYGVLQPIIVRPAENSSEGYIIVAGERRWRACQIAKVAQIPAIVRTLESLQHMEMALVENVQRVDLSPLEQAVSIERLHQQFDLAYDTIAERLGKAISTVHNIVRLLQLPSTAREALEQKSITEGHARAILALKDMPDQQDALLEMIVNNGWSVRQAERYVTSVKQGIADKQAVRQRVATETPATRALSKRLAAPVRITRTAKGGRLEITFTNDDELTKIISSL